MFVSKIAQLGVLKGVNLFLDLPFFYFFRFALLKCAISLFRYEYGIYYLESNETTSNTYNIGLPNVQVRELEINTADNKLYAVTCGRGLWLVNLFALEA